MVTNRIVVATTNRGKLQEFTRLFADLPATLVSLADVVPSGFHVEETGSTFEDNAVLKARAAAQVSGLVALADDSGIVVDALDGRPGVYSARYAGPNATDQMNNELLLAQLAGVPPEQRTARFVCCLVVAIPNEKAPTILATAHGTVEGRILLSPRGDGGFGYDPLFEPLDAPGQTTAELPGEQKDRLSHRGRAARAIFAKLSDWLVAEARSGP